jgi:hypothetical protein
LHETVSVIDAGAVVGRASDAHTLLAAVLQRAGVSIHARLVVRLERVGAANARLTDVLRAVVPVIAVVEDTSAHGVETYVFLRARIPVITGTREVEMDTAISAIAHVIGAGVVIGASDRRSLTQTGLIAPVIRGARVAIITRDPDGDRLVLARACLRVAAHVAAARLVFHAGDDGGRVHPTLAGDADQGPVAQVSIIERRAVLIRGAGAVDGFTDGAHPERADVVGRAQLSKVAGVTVLQGCIIAAGRQACVERAVVAVIAERLRRAYTLEARPELRAGVTVVA